MDTGAQYCLSLHNVCRRMPFHSFISAPLPLQTAAMKGTFDFGAAFVDLDVDGHQDIVVCPRFRG